MVVRQVRHQLMELSADLDSLIREIKYKNNLLALPISYPSTHSVSLSCFLPNSYGVMLPSKMIEEVIHRKYETETKGINESTFYHITESIFEVKDYIKEYNVGDADFLDVQLAIDEVVELLGMHVGYNKHVGKFSVTEFANQIRENIYGLECEYNEAFKEKILYDLEHLIFRLATYYGKDQNQLFIQFSYLNDKEYGKKYMDEETPTEVNVDKAFWDRMLLLCDDYLDDEEFD